MYKPIKIILLVSFFLLTPFSHATTEPPATDQSPCYLDGLSERFTCGYITVAEDAKRPDGRQIQIHYAILPSIKSSDTQEVFMPIAGGPGQSAIDNAALFANTFSKVRQQQDILLIDQRGTGRSNLLNCEDETEVNPLTINEETVDVKQQAQHCLDSIDADITQYGSLTALDDFEAVRQHLGYQKLHLYGISYGSRMAQLYQKHYPEVLSTVTLDGVVPMQQSVLAIGNAIDRALKLLLDECASQELCRQQFPQLSSELEQVNTQLEKQAFISEIIDPVTGEPVQLTMTKTKFMGAIRMALYTPNIRTLIPHAISQAAQGNYQAIIGLYALTIDMTGIAMGMHASVVCGEDWLRLTELERTNAQQSYFGQEMLTSFTDTCAVWNMPAVAENFSEPISSDIPTLLLSGHLDPATPPSWGDLATQKLTNYKHFIAPYATHGVATQTCANDLIAELVTTKKLETLDEKCLSKDNRRSFYLNSNTVEALSTQVIKTQGVGHD